jgi:hypothetical protein
MHLSPFMPRARAEKLQHNLRAKLEKHAVSPEVVQPVMGILAALEKDVKTSKSRGVGSWNRALAQALDARICGYVSQSSMLVVNHEMDLCRCLLILGELLISDADASASISASGVTAIQAIASNTLQIEGSSLSLGAAVRSHAFAALGKLCLQREDLAKKFVELFVLHLSSREAFAVRNNVLMVLRELCERYTSLVDRFVPSMTDLLRDSNELLRKQAVTVLASLLSESYLKFKGSIVHRFLYALSDPAASVRKLAESVVVRILHPRNPALFPQVFLDVICALNGWAGHPGLQSAVENKEFSLLDSPSRRTIIYRFILSLMTNEQKFTLYSQMVSVFLTPFVEVEDRVELPRCAKGPCGQSLHDVLALLVCKEMRICFSPKQASQDDDADVAGAAGPNQVGAEEARTAVTRMFKRVMCDHVVPVLVQLKNLMEKQHSVFLGNLRRCLCEILREFKDDLPDILTNDRQLASEIAFDLGSSAEAAAEPSTSEGDPVAAASLPSGSAAEIQRPSTSTHELSKAAVKAVIRAAGKRRPLSKMMGASSNPNSPDSVHGKCEEDVSEAVTRAVTKSTRNVKTSNRQPAATAAQPAVKRQRLLHAAEPPSLLHATARSKSVIETEGLKVSGRSVPTPHSMKPAGLLSVLQHQSAEHTSPSCSASNSKGAASGEHAIRAPGNAASRPTPAVGGLAGLINRSRMKQ